jgi:hypothetical protein
MKKLFLLVCISIILSFSNCKEDKDENRNITEYRVTVDEELKALNLYNNELEIRANYPPDNFPEETTIRIYTVADTAGLFYKIIPENSEYFQGGIRYLEKESRLKIKVAERTSLENNQILVGKGNDRIYLDIDNGRYTVSIPVETEPAVKMTFWSLGGDPTNNTGTVFLYDLDLNYLSRPSLRIFSDRDPVGFMLTSDYNDPYKYQVPAPFESYTADFSYNEFGPTIPWQFMIAAEQGERIYIEYMDRVYYAVCFEWSSIPMLRIR